MDTLSPCRMGGKKSSRAYFITTGYDLPKIKSVLQFFNTVFSVTS